MHWMSNEWHEKDTVANMNYVPALLHRQTERKQGPEKIPIRQIITSCKGCLRNTHVTRMTCRHITTTDKPRRDLASPLDLGMIFCRSWGTPVFSSSSALRPLTPPDGTRLTSTVSLPHLTTIGCDMLLVVGSDMMGRARDTQAAKGRPKMEARWKMVEEWHSSIDFVFPSLQVKRHK